VAGPFPRSLGEQSRHRPCDSALSEPPRSSMAPGRSQNAVPGNSMLAIPVRERNRFLANPLLRSKFSRVCTFAGIAGRGIERSNFRTQCLFGETDDR
jgi:hypothetical protein